MKKRATGPGPVRTARGGTRPVETARGVRVLVFLAGVRLAGAFADVPFLVVPELLLEVDFRVLRVRDEEPPADPPRVLPRLVVDVLLLRDPGGEDVRVAMPPNLGGRHTSLRDHRTRVEAGRPASARVGPPDARTRIPGSPGRAPARAPVRVPVRVPPTAVGGPARPRVPASVRMHRVVCCRGATAEDGLSRAGD
ncbi:hypothetical protein GCM10023340_32610 [Nocardioides marinquilinus]|uniref:Secreted protein n=1 Tax=Nocardioides marinquilinus TaxID=1210400 RepID=A0ABP9PUE4_9ACTN